MNLSMNRLAYHNATRHYDQNNRPIRHIGIWLTCIAIGYLHMKFVEGGHILENRHNTLIFEIWILRRCHDNVFNDCKIDCARKKHKALLVYITRTSSFILLSFRLIQEAKIDFNV